MTTMSLRLSAGARQRLTYARNAALLAALILPAIAAAAVRETVVGPIWLGRLW